jgi:hypothetical protein
VCRFDFEGVDVKGLFDEYHETEKRMKELKEKGGIQRQVSQNLHWHSIFMCMHTLMPGQAACGTSCCSAAHSSSTDAWW